MGYRIGVDDQEIRRNVGILTETPGLYPSLSAWRNLLIYAKLYEVEEPELRVEKYLRWLGLWDRRNDAAGSFSKGMRQKLAIARAHIHEPAILFLDEPTSGLDPESAKLVRDFIEELRGTGRTIFMCTHNLDEADRLCDRVAVFKTQLKVVDTPANLRKSLFERQVVFHLLHLEENWIERLSAKEYIKRVEHVDNKLILTLDDPEGRNPEIIRTLVEWGADIQFVGEIRRSLEDIYLQLVN